MTGVCVWVYVNAGTSVWWPVRPGARRPERAWERETERPRRLLELHYGETRAVRSGTGDVCGGGDGEDDDDDDGGGCCG